MNTDKIKFLANLTINYLINKFILGNENNNVLLEAQESGEKKIQEIRQQILDEFPQLEQSAVDSIFEEVYNLKIRQLLIQDDHICSLCVHYGLSGERKEYCKFYNNDLNVDSECETFEIDPNKKSEWGEFKKTLREQINYLQECLQKNEGFLRI